MVTIALSDDLANSLFSLTQLQDQYPHVLSGIKEWFRWYKTPDNKPLNTYGFNEMWLDEVETRHVIQETHLSWGNLVQGKHTNDEHGLWIPSSPSS